MLQGMLVSSSQYWPHQEETDTGVYQMVIRAFVISRLDSSSALYCGLPSYLLSQNAKGAEFSCSSCLWLFSVGPHTSNTRSGEAPLVAHPTACHIQTVFFSCSSLWRACLCSTYLICFSNTNPHDLLRHRRRTFLVISEDCHIRWNMFLHKQRCGPGTAYQQSWEIPNSHREFLGQSLKHICIKKYLLMTKRPSSIFFQLFFSM